VDVDQMLEGISSRLLSEWMAFSLLEPFGYDVNMFGHAQTAATFFNMNRPKGEHARDPKDFYPVLAKAEEENDEKSMDVFGILKTVLMGGKTQQ